jgi:hypothetical protein
MKAILIVTLLAASGAKTSGIPMKNFEECKKQAQVRLPEMMQAYVGQQVRVNMKCFNTEKEKYFHFTTLFNMAGGPQNKGNENGKNKQGPVIDPEPELEIK